MSACTEHRPLPVSFLSYQRHSHLRSNRHDPLPQVEVASDMQYYPQIQQWNTAYPKYGQTHPPLPSSECADCNTECTEPMCTTSNELTAQCTDQCIVITCSDPEHDSLSCTDRHSRCDFVCGTSTDCTDCSGLDDFLRCCEEYHPCYTDANRGTTFPHQQSPSNNSWDSALADVLCGCGNSTESGKLYPHTIPPVATSVSLTPPMATPVFPSTIDNDRHYSPALVGYSLLSPNQNYAQTPTSLPPVFQAQSLDASTAQYATAHNLQPQSSARPSLLTCMWGNCQAQFTLLSELVGHVNLQHLRLPTASEGPTNPTSHLSPVLHHHQADTITKLPCLWRDCNENLSPELLSDGCLNGNSMDLMLSKLASHLLQDHLGVQSFDSSYQYTSAPDRMPTAEIATFRQGQRNQQSQSQYGQGGSDANTINTISIQASGPDSHGSQPCRQEVILFTPPSPQTTATAVSSPSDTVGDALGEGYACRWDSCRMTFETCDDLMAHMSTEHVGSGKPQYDCLWEGCPRNGDKGFSSKQKICRHLQSHTGYRPFQCPECQQNFSEAATLQQHIRRHTQEKPYKCDFPGCGKSFAITGALTIHKRIHNGHKPFKCTYCDRAFAESSNLSKHLRTHTGERPYVCHEPGCGKTFARPDQLTRHTGVHRKKALAAAA